MGMQEEIEKSLGILSAGGSILYPTDTIWGIGCDATRPAAVSRLYEIKERQDSRVMLILVDSKSMLEKYVEEVPDMALEILALSPQALTIIYPGARGLAANLIQKDGSVGIRITGDPFCSGLIRAFRKPIVSSSANRSGHPAPAFYNQIDASIISSVDYAVDWRRDDRHKRKPSGILKVGLKGEIEVIRKQA